LARAHEASRAAGISNRALAGRRVI
jgi:hypothetical protein